MSQEGSEQFRFNFKHDGGEEAKGKSESGIQILEIRSHGGKEGRPVWWSKMNPDDIPDEPKMGKFVCPGESHFESPNSSEEDGRDSLPQKQKAVRDLSARKVKLVPSLDSWDPEFSSLFVQFETGLPSNPLIRSLHPDIINVSRPKWAVERGGCCLEFGTPELAAEALNDIEEKTVEGHQVKVDFLYNIKNKKPRLKRCFEKTIEEDWCPENKRNGGSVKGEVEEERETDISDLGEGPAFEVDYDILRELGMKLIPEPPNKKEKLKVKFGGDVKELKQKSSDEKEESVNKQINQRKQTIPLSVPTDFKAELEITKIKSVKEAEDLKQNSCDLKEGMGQSKKKKKKRKKRKNKFDQKAESEGAGSGNIKSNGKVQQLDPMESQTMKTDNQESKKKKNLKQKLSYERKESVSSQIEQEKEMIPLSVSIDMNVGSGSTKMKPVMEAEDLKQNASDLKEETKQSKKKNKKRTSDQKAESQGAGSGSLKTNGLKQQLHPLEPETSKTDKQQAERKKNLEQKSYYERKLPKSSQMEQEKEIICLSDSADLKAGPESTEMKMVKAAENLKQRPSGLEEGMKQSKRKNKKRKRSVQKAKSEGGSIKANGWIQQSHPLEPEAKETDMQQGEKKKGMKQRLCDEVETKSPVLHRPWDLKIPMKNINIKQGKRTKDSNQSLTDQKENLESVDVSPKEVTNGLSDLKAEIKNNEINKAKEKKDLKQNFSDFKWKTQKLDSEGNKKNKKRKLASVSDFVVDKKRKISGNESNNRDNNEKIIKTKKMLS